MRDDPEERVPPPKGNPLPEERGEPDERVAPEERVVPDVRVVPDGLCEPPVPKKMPKGNPMPKGHELPDEPVCPAGREALSPEKPLKGLGPSDGFCGSGLGRSAPILEYPVNGLEEPAGRDAAPMSRKPANRGDPVPL